jgi:hypothetical protein
MVSSPIARIGLGVTVDDTTLVAVFVKPSSNESVTSSVAVSGLGAPDPPHATAESAHSPTTSNRPTRITQKLVEAFESLL